MMPTDLSHDSLQPQRAKDLMPERVFAGLWKELQVRQLAVDLGYGALELVLNTIPLQEGAPAETVAEHYRAHPIDPVSQRDATVAASVIQWLGTDQGACFIMEAEKRIAIERQRLLVVHHQSNNLGCQKCRHLGTLQLEGAGQADREIWNLYRCSQCKQQYVQGVIPDTVTLDASVIHLTKAQ